jgi:O-antigen ligase
MAVIYFIGILLLMLFLGRRAGFALVLINGLLTLFVRTVNISSLLKYGLLFSVFWLTLQLTFVEEVIENANPRVYQLIYDRDVMVTEDRSYLTRVAMVEKGLYLFNEYPLSGVGLTNFHHTEAIIAGDFEGSQYIINKDEINQLSAHNSYVSALSEGGLVLFVPWTLLMLSIIIRFAINIARIDPKYYPLFWGFLGMIFHYTSVVGYINVYSWFIIAMCGVILSRIGEKHVNTVVSNAIKQ